MHFQHRGHHVVLLARDPVAVAHQPLGERPTCGSEKVLVVVGRHFAEGKSVAGSGEPNMCSASL